MYNFQNQIFKSCINLSKHTIPADNGGYGNYSDHLLLNMKIRR